MPAAGMGCEDCLVWSCGAGVMRTPADHFRARVAVRPCIYPRKHSEPARQVCHFQRIFCMCPARGLCALLQVTCLEQEDGEGNVEYKYRIKDPHPVRLQQLVSWCCSNSRCAGLGARARGPATWPPFSGCRYHRPLRPTVVADLLPARPAGLPSRRSRSSSTACLRATASASTTLVSPAHDSTSHPRLPASSTTSLHAYTQFLTPPFFRPGRADTPPSTQHPEPSPARPSPCPPLSLPSLVPAHPAPLLPCSPAPLLPAPLPTVPYAIPTGVEDNGYPKGLEPADLDGSIATLQHMAASLGACVSLVHYLPGAWGRRAALLRVAHSTAQVGGEGRRGQRAAVGRSGA